MGATILTLHYPGNLSATEVKAKFREQVESDRDEFGSEGYSGSWNTCSDIYVEQGPPKRSLSDAVSHYGDTLEKRTSVAVRVFDDRTTKGDRTPLLVSLEKKIESAKEDLTNFNVSFFKRLHEAKSKTRGCKCGSNIAVSYLKYDKWSIGPGTVKCPVCGEVDFCLADGDVAKKERLIEKVKIAKEALETETARIAATKRDVVWLVMGCAST